MNLMLGKTLSMTTSQIILNKLIDAVSFSKILATNFKLLLNEILIEHATVKMYLLSISHAISE